MRPAGEPVAHTVLEPTEQPMDCCPKLGLLVPVVGELVPITMGWPLVLLVLLAESMGYSLVPLAASRANARAVVGLGMVGHRDAEAL